MITDGGNKKYEEEVLGLMVPKIFESTVDYEKILVIDMVYWVSDLFVQHHKNLQTGLI